MHPDEVSIYVKNYLPYRTVYLHIYIYMFSITVYTHLIVGFQKLLEMLACEKKMLAQCITDLSKLQFPESTEFVHVTTQELS